MVATPLFPPTEVIHLSGISWHTYEALLQELSSRRLRITYHRGNLEIIAPSPEHEFSKTIIGRFVETLAEELDIRIHPLGSTTFKHPDLSGTEPDECFYFRNITAVRGKKRLVPGKDPVPDLVIEIDVTSSSRDRLQIYAELGVAEVWVYDGASLAICQLQDDEYDDEYIDVPRSQFFPTIPIRDIAGFLQQAGTMDYLELVKLFRQWVRGHLGNEG